ncbi:MAG TPA: porphobilinogen synthase [Sedimentisphaerales bacterium]|nr:porphobilinogen synthase [Sedimentisphaerales bacterium]HRS12944.1 porphobilinogen synthase [Sedimentisphaerales bacterium]HRV49559.1 porphobilinogen synthase [Sedimentisphaerales bacterium]
MGFPEIRMRRLRTSVPMRRMVRETRLSVDDLVYPLFACPGRNVREPIASMTDCFHLSADRIADEAARVADLGIPAVLLFGLPEKKDERGSEAWSESGAVQSAIRAIKKHIPDLLVITDVCLCAYTSTGHCGVIKNHRLDNDATCELLAKTALSHAQAGADIVAPSDMMDGRIGAMRQVLEKNGFDHVAILSYAAKFASAFYGPFRDAAESAPSPEMAAAGLGDRKTYQMDPANAREALREIALDIDEGADMVMVKPALSFLDVICRARERFDCPIAAYNVSGEYMMLHAAAARGLLDHDTAMMEILTSIKRAGADIVITYSAKAAAARL